MMYFDMHGKSNTDQTLKLAFERGTDLGLNEVVIASTTGETALKASEIFKDFRITAVIREIICKPREFLGNMSPAARRIKNAP